MKQESEVIAELKDLAVNVSLVRPSLEPFEKSKRNPDSLIGTLSNSRRPGREQKDREYGIHVRTLWTEGASLNQRKLP